MNESGVDAGGTYTYQYELLATGELTGLPNEAVSRFRETDRNGNITEYEFNPLGYVITQKEFTKGLREGEPDFFETRFEYNTDGRLLKQINAQGNEVPYFLDESSDSRFAQSNVLVSTQLPDERGGDQDRIRTLSLYEPIYQQVSLSVDPRGVDPNFIPPITDPSGRSQLERYSTRYFFDYQEGDAAIILPLLTEELGLDPMNADDLAAVQAQLDAAGVMLGLGDLNGDGIISDSIAGNVVAMVAPSVVLLEGANQTDPNREGDRLQDIFTLYRYNQFGQIISTVDAEGNVDTFEYFAENDPDGDGIVTLPPADGRTLNTIMGGGITEGGGYLKKEIQDAEHLIINGHQPNNNSGAQATEITTQYEYDPVGNTTAIIDGRGIRTEYVVNELDQVVRTIRAAEVPASGTGNVDEPLDLVAFRYTEDVEYDHNGNVVVRRIQDRGKTSNTGDDEEIAVVQTNEFGDYSFEGVADGTYWVYVDATHVNLEGRPYGGGDVDVTPLERQTAVRLVTIEGDNMTVNFPFDSVPGVPSSGNVSQGGSGTISGNVFEDSNGDDILTNGESGLGDITVTLYRDDDDEYFEPRGFVHYKFEYDILDNLVREKQEVDVDTTLTTEYRYDRNENLTLTLHPEGNATTAVYDERDLLFVSTRGAFKATPDTLSPPPATNPDLATQEERPYDVRGGVPCQCTTYNYDLNGNLVEMVDSDDTDLSAANNGKIGLSDLEGDVTRFVHDGFDRQVTTIDAVGNRTVVEYDPVSNVVAQRVYGPVDGPSPTNTNGTDNVLLSEMFHLHDELNRQFQSDYTLFVADGTITDRTPDIKDGPLTPEDMKVTTRTEYDRKSRVTFTVEDDEDPNTTENEGTSQIDYDGADRQIKTTDAVGNTVEFAYDNNNNLIEMKETDVSEIEGIDDEVFLSTYFYDSLNRLQQTTDNIGQTMFYRYDSRDNLVAMADAQGPVTDATINRRAFLLDPNEPVAINDFGNITRYFYDGINRQIRSEQILTESGEGDGFNAGATIEGIKILASGNSSAATNNTLTDDTQMFTDNEYLDRTITIVKGTGAGQSRTITANTADTITVGSDWDIIPDATSEYEIAPIPLPDQTQGGGDGFIRTGYVYDDNSLLSALLDDQGNITLYLYDNLNRQVTETKGLVITSPFTETFILGDRQVVTPTAATINDPTFISELLLQEQINGAKARIDEIADLFQPLADDVPEPPDVPPAPQATTIVYGYSPDDNVLILEDENDSETFTKYDAINRAIAVRIFRSGQNDDFTGDSIFAPDPVNDFEGPPRNTFPPVIGTNINNYEYDGLSRLTSATDNNDPDVTSDDSLVTYAYDSLSRMIEEKQQIGDLPVQVISSGYTADTRSSVIYPNGRKLYFTFDSLDRLQSITDDGATEAIVEYDYIGVGRVLERRSPTNGTRMTYLNDAGNMVTGYDELRRTVELRHFRDGESDPFVGFEYGYDRMNNRTYQRKLHDPDNSELYEYDSVYRLINFERGMLNEAGDTITTPSTNGTQSQQWQLDGSGNWDVTTGVDENGDPIFDDREHSSVNELLTQEGATLRYDDNGNLIEDENYLYEWDSRNRLRRATRKLDDVVSEYFYDAMGRRIRKIEDMSDPINTTTDFYYDGQRVVEERDSSNILTQQYVYGNYIDEVLVMDRNEDGDDSAIGDDDERLHYHQDALFSVYAVTDENGEILESYLYDPYGEVTIFDANGVEVDDHDWGAANSLIDNPYLFTGRRFDEETGLYYYRARYLDADQGRFISRDIIPSINIYQFVGSHVPNAVDPFGLFKVTILNIKDWESPRLDVVFVWFKLKINLKLELDIKLNTTKASCPTQLPWSNIKGDWDIDTYSESKAIGIDAWVGATGQNFSAKLGYKIGISQTEDTWLSDLIGDSPYLSWLNSSIDTGRYNELNASGQIWLPILQYNGKNIICPCIKLSGESSVALERGFFPGRFGLAVGVVAVGTAAAPAFAAFAAEIGSAGAILEGMRRTGVLVFT